MIQVFDYEYSPIIPTQPTKNAVAVFNTKCASIAFTHMNVDFVIAMDEETGKFKYCFSLYECEKFFTKDTVI